MVGIESRDTGPGERRTVVPVRALVAAVAVLLLLSGTAFVGTAEASSHTEIEDWNDLANISDSDNYDGDYPSGTYVLVNDLNESTDGYDEHVANPTGGWDPLMSQSTQFRGTFDGQGHVIEDLEIDRPGESRVGLFARTWQATIKDVTVRGNVTGYQITGMVEGGKSRTQYTNISVHGNVTGHNRVGGVVGSATKGDGHGGFTNISASVNVTGNRDNVGGVVGKVKEASLGEVTASGNVTGRKYVGGVAGRVTDSGTVITDASASADVTGQQGAGGLVGVFLGDAVGSSSASGNVTWTSGSPTDEFIAGFIGKAGNNDGVSVDISNSWASGDVTGGDARGVGGAIGRYVGGEDNSDATITNLTAYGDVSGESRVGGAIGIAYQQHEITDATAHGDVNESKKWHNVEHPGTGGLIGDHRDGILKQSSAHGYVTGGERAGGLVGYTDRTSTVKTSYATGNVSGVKKVGGLIGRMDGVEVKNSYAVGNVTSGVGDPPRRAEAGGLVGWQNGGTVSKSYAVGSVTVNKVETVGGLVGNGTGTITNSYYDTGTTGHSTTRAGVGTALGDFEERANNMTGADADGGMSGFSFSGGPWETGETAGYPYPVLEDLNTTRQNQTDVPPVLPDLNHTVDNWNDLDSALSNYRGKIILQSDIDSDSNGYSGSVAPFGNGGSGWKPRAFSGTLVGNNHTISDLYIDRGDSEDTLGFFSTLSNKATVTDVTFEDPTINEDWYGNDVGVVAGKSRALFSNVHVTGSTPVKGNDRVGGMVGQLNRDATVEDSTVAVELKTDGEQAGGLAGRMTAGASVRNVTTTGGVTRGRGKAGGLVGWVKGGSITDARATGEVNIAGSNNAGGLVARMDSGGSITNASATGEVTGGRDVGGLVARTDGDVTITNAYATGDVNAKNRGGGLVGLKNDLGSNTVGGTIQDTYAAGNVTIRGTSGKGAGLVARQDAGSIKRSYAVGKVSGPEIGGVMVNLVGGSVTDTYWDNGTVRTTASAAGIGKGESGTRSDEMTGSGAVGNLSLGSNWSNSGGEYSYPVLDALNTTAQEDITASGPIAAGIQTVTNWTELDSALDTTTAQIKLGATLNASTDGFGQVNGSWEPREFGGSFDFNGNEIRDLVIDNSSTDRVGLFSQLRNDASVTDPALANITVVGNQYTGTLAGVSSLPIAGASATTVDVDGHHKTGGLVGKSTEDIDDALITGEVAGRNNAGGLVGLMDDANVTGANTSVTITDGSDNVGGVAGKIRDGKISHSTASGDIDISGDGSVGGLAGQVKRGTVEFSNATGDINTVSVTSTGGLVGTLDDAPATITNSYATGNVTATGNNAGGLVGSVNSRGAWYVKSSYATGDVSGTDDVGGLMGSVRDGNGENLVNKSYAIGDVSGDTDVGGFVGWSDQNRMSYVDSYALGNVTGSNRVGGFAGRTQAELKRVYAAGVVTGGSGLVGTLNVDQITEGYWDTEATGQSDGIGSGSSTGASGNTTAEMQGAPAKTNMSGFSYSGSPWTAVENGDDQWGSDSEEVKPGYPIIAGLNESLQIQTQELLVEPVSDSDKFEIRAPENPAAGTKPTVTLAIKNVGATPKRGNNEDYTITANHGTFTVLDNTRTEAVAGDTIRLVDLEWDLTGADPNPGTIEARVFDGGQTFPSTPPKAETYTIVDSATLDLAPGSLTATTVNQSSGESFQVDVNFTNNANSAAKTVQLTTTQVTGSNVTVSGPTSIANSVASGESKNVTVTVDVEAGAPPGDASSRVVDFTTDFKLDGQDVVKSKGLPVAVDSTHTIGVTTSNPEFWSRNPGGSIDFSFTATSTGNDQLSGFEPTVTDQFTDGGQTWITFDGVSDSLAAGDSQGVTGTIEIPDDAAKGDYTATVQFDSDSADPVTRKLNVTVGANEVLQASLADKRVTTAIGSETTVTELTLSNPGNVPWVYHGNDTTLDESISGSGTYKDEVSVGVFGGSLGAGTTATVPVTANVSSEATQKVNITYQMSEDDGSTLTSNDISDTVTLNITGVPFTVGANSNWKSTTDLPLQTQTGSSSTIEVDVSFGGSPITSTDDVTFNATLSNESTGAGEYDAATTATHLGGGTFELDVTAGQSVPDARVYDVGIEVEDVESGAVTRTTLSDGMEVPDETGPTVLSVSAPPIAFTGNETSGNTTVTIEASDNDLAGVENVTFDVLDADDSSLPGLEGVVADRKSDPDPVDESTWTANSTWTKEIEVSETGTMSLDVTAEDVAGLTGTGSAKLRVAQEVNFTGNIVDSSNEGQNMTMTFIDANGDEAAEITTGDDGKYDKEIVAGNYDIEMSYNEMDITLENATINGTDDPIDMDTINKTDAPAPDTAEEAVMSLGGKVDLPIDSATITFDYSGKDFRTGRARVARCSNYNFSTISCDGEYEVVDHTINRPAQTVTVPVAGFSSYTLYEAPPSRPGLGGGGGDGGGGGTSLSFDQQEALSELADENVSALGTLGRLNSAVGNFDDLGSAIETINEFDGDFDNLDNLDKLDDFNQSQGNLNGSSEDLEDIKEEVTRPSQAITTDRSRINEELIRGERIRTSIGIRNELTETQDYSITVSGDVSEFVDMQNSVTVEPDELEDLLIQIAVPEDADPGLYSGLLNIESDAVQTEVPVNIRVQEGEGRTLGVSANPTSPSIEPGQDARAEVTLVPDGFTGPVETEVQMELVHRESEEVYATATEQVTLESRQKQAMEVTVPENAPLGAYELRVEAEGARNGETYESSSIAGMTVELPTLQQSAFGLTYLQIILLAFGLVLALLVAYLAYGYRRRQLEAQQRYTDEIDLDSLPDDGRRGAYLGRLADRDAKAYLDIDDLTTHALIAGATGSGKSVTGQIIAEEALKKGANVIVIDPTAQWSGFLSECEDEGMLGHYGEFDLTRDDATSFDGNIRAVEPGGQIDIGPYLDNETDSEIYVFGLHKLDNKNIDEFVDHTIQQVFDANLQEKDQLDTLIVYDETHRLLEQFGGSGAGLNQLERAVREFRKWGVGMVLLSQVVSDFSGEIRANIGTTVQMRTQYDGDLERLEAKYGRDTIKSIAKAEVGSGMFQNSEYNHGRPYFVNFRPLLHSPYRLSDEELDKFEDYNRRIIKLEDIIGDMPEDDAYEYRTELKLVKKNLQKGSFNLVEIYLEELEEDLQASPITNQQPAEDDD